MTKILSQLRIFGTKFLSSVRIFDKLQLGPFCMVVSRKIGKAYVH